MICFLNRNENSYPTYKSWYRVHVPGLRHYRVEYRDASGEWERLTKQYASLGEAEYAARKDAGSPARIIKVTETEEVLDVI